MNEQQLYQLVESIVREELARRNLVTQHVPIHRDNTLLVVFT